MKRITGTHVYGYLECPRAAALDLHLPREKRRPPHPWEAFARRRGRDFEAEFVADLDAAEPQYAERDWKAGAEATLGLMREGVPWVFQGVLLGEDRLGIPDLLRRVDGASALGGHHYEVVDVKSSGRPRGDQVLQVVFYSRLLAVMQARMPERGALVLKDGREETFLLSDYAAAAAEVEEELFALRADADKARPFYGPACERCHWNEICVPEMETADDLSLVDGMTRGARAMLEAAGHDTAAALAELPGEKTRHHVALDAPLLRRLRRAAQARAAGRPVREHRPKGTLLPRAALVHFLTDGFADRVLWMGLLHPVDPAAEPVWACPGSREQEWQAFHDLVQPVPADRTLLHCGSALPRWYEDRAWLRQAEVGLETRFVDVVRRLRGAALFPAPVFGVYDMVRHGLGVDPDRHGHAGAAALWLEEDGGTERLCRKGVADLLDLAELVNELLAEREEEGGSESRAATPQIPRA